MIKKRSPYCILLSPPHESLCAMVQAGDCSIDCEEHTVWMCSHYVLSAIRRLDEYPWWRRIYIKHIYNKYLKDLERVRRAYTPKEFREEMEKW